MLSSLLTLCPKIGPIHQNNQIYGIGLFLISLACPCFDTEKDAAEMGQGAELLLMGILWFFFVSPGFVWLANLLLLVSWTSAERRRNRSFITSIIAILIALCFLFYKDIMTDEGGSNTTPITAHRIGYWLWLASMFTMIAGNLYMQLFADNTDQTQSGFKRSFCKSHQNFVHCIVCESNKERSKDL